MVNQEQDQTVQILNASRSAEDATIDVEALVDRAAGQPALRGDEPVLVVTPPQAGQVLRVELEPGQKIMLDGIEIDAVEAFNHPSGLIVLAGADGWIILPAPPEAGADPAIGNGQEIAASDEIVLVLPPGGARGG